MAIQDSEQLTFSLKLLGMKVYNMTFLSSHTKHNKGQFNSKL